MKQLCTGFIAAGLILVVASVIWPKLDTGRSSWSDEKAKAYQDVSLDYHNLSFRDPNKAENRRLLDETKAKFEVLKSELDSSRERGNKVATWLRWTGVVLAIVGGVGVMTTREP